ncbi:hypothetical protein MES4922_340002 [Mesorhizobium ventifaucium]|uniref:Uncharacterized protein n=1 Tax=Mesorhizobium ventifaucium TaxID=666020 RepID=A0ABM9E4J1_9HYPH|nr:hypothetical protein MES4922_340002 [Mesorhizobium ventifaucium]
MAHASGAARTRPVPRGACSTHPIRDKHIEFGYHAVALELAATGGHLGGVRPLNTGEWLWPAFMSCRTRVECTCSPRCAASPRRT